MRICTVVLGWLALISILSSACTTATERDPEYTVVRDIVVDHWREQYGYITNGSADALSKYVIREVDHNGMEKCKHNPGVVPIGCYQGASNTILVYVGLPTSEKERVFSHELLHLLYLNDFGDIQADHTDHCVWDEFGEDTLESRIAVSVKF